MCRLLGLRANRPVDINFSLVTGETPFSDLSRDNPDGWGMGWYDGGHPKIFKEAVPASSSKKLKEMPCTTISDIFVCHVRKSTGTEKAKRNCHPFMFEKWLFAHNGSLKETGLRGKLSQRHLDAIAGDTDSEVYFHWILQNVEECDGNVERGLATALRTIDNYKGLNFIMTDGQKLFAFRYASKNVDYYSLFCLERDPEQTGPATFQSRETQAFIESKRLSGEKAVLVCSEKLTEERWEEVPLGSLVTISADLNVTVRHVWPNG